MWTSPVWVPAVWFQDIQEVHAEVARYIDHYNHERPHQSLDYQTPGPALRKLKR
jgi:transposase InsO family protein